MICSLGFLPLQREAAVRAKAQQAQLHNLALERRDIQHVPHCFLLCRELDVEPLGARRDETLRGQSEYFRKFKYFIQLHILVRALRRHSSLWCIWHTHLLSRAASTIITSYRFMKHFVHRSLYLSFLTGCGWSGLGCAVIEGDDETKHFGNGTAWLRLSVFAEP